MNIAKSKYLPTAACCVVALVPVCVFAYWRIPTTTDRLLYILLKSAFILPLFLVPHLLLRQRRALILSSIVLLFGIPLELIHLELFKDYITTQGIYTAYVSLQGIAEFSRTHLTEALGFSRGLWGDLFFCFVLLCAWVTAVATSPDQYLLDTHRARRTASVLVLFCATLAAGQVLYYYRLATDNWGHEGKYFVKQHVIKEYPLNLYYRLYEIELRRRTSAAFGTVAAAFRFQAVQLRTSSERQVYVLIIGESGRFANYGFDGYARDTTPNLSNVKGLLTFSDFFSTANVTTYGVPLMITRATPSAYQVAYQEKSIVSLFKEAGFSTHWISNQDIFSGLGAGLYKNEADSFEASDSFDEAVLPPLEKALRLPEARQFIVINLRGNHYSKDAYPKEFDRFKPNIGDDYVSLDPSNRAYFVNSYDNSVLYQDFVLHSILKALMTCKCQTWAYFSADHGESLFDPPLKLYGHGSPQIPREQLHIPVFAWFSDEYVEQWPSVYDAMQRNRMRRLSTTNSFYTLADLGGISFKDNNSELSFASPQFKEAPNREVYTGEGFELVE